MWSAFGCGIYDSGQQDSSYQRASYEQKREGSFMKKKVRPVPKFRKEQDERDFWNTHDTTEYFDFSKSNRVEIEFDPGIEAPVKSISLRLPREILNELKVLANKKDIPYQSLIKVYLAQKIAEERKAG
jgi:predicted DNA binding CopG/RHH family protein